MENKEIVLSVKDLKVNFSTDNGYVQAVRGVSFDLYKGETLCIVGESGSGKSVTNKAIMGILSKNGRVVEGSIMYEGEDLTKISEDEFHRIRGHKIGMIFQDPLSSLNPIVRIGKQITEGMLINASRTKKMYNELVADSLTAYRNAQTELKNGLAKGTENIKFLKSEKKKHINLAKNKVSNEIGGRLYTAKQDCGAAVFEIESKENDQILALKAENLEKEAYEARLAKIKEAANAEKAKFEEAYLAEKNKIEANKPTLIEKSKAEVAEITAKYDALIAQAQAEYKETKPSLIAEYKPKIAEAKAKFEAESKVAKEKVAKFKLGLKEEYQKKAAAIKAEAKASRDNFLYDLSEAKKDFIAAYTTAKSTGRPKSVLDQIKNENFERVATIKTKIKALNRKEKADLSAAKAEYISSLRITKAEAKAKALEIMAEVGIKDPEKRFRQYPFEFSGGMRQRIVIAIALTANPDILICDEPTTALDVTIQAQILELINKLKRERGLSCIFITHDLGVVANMADRVAVMYAGKIVEYGTEEEIFYDPKHPYTWALLSSIPDVDSNEKLDAIPGTPPNMIYPPVGDAFALRSKYAMEIDFKKQPPFFKVSDTHYAATWLLDPRAPKVEMPQIVKSRIENSLKTHKKGGNK